MAKKDAHWMEKAFKNAHGQLHKATGTPAGKDIPAKKIAKAMDSKDSHTRHMAEAARNAEKARKKG